jgi:hypothetical protein
MDLDWGNHNQPSSHFDVHSHTYSYDNKNKVWSGSDGGFNIFW